MPTTLSTEQETNPWLAAEARFDEAATLLNLDDGICNRTHFERSYSGAVPHKLWHDEVSSAHDDRHEAQVGV